MAINWTYEETIAEMRGFDLILRTKTFDLSEEREQEKFKFLAERLRIILNQIELHDDYEGLLADRKKLNQISDILIDRMRGDAEKRNELATEFEKVTEETYPFF